ncbi:MAG: peptidoglycan/xylan/chitin deacetylase (PgdA/CDA1 family) [Bermanella sp.]|jgi:peptidoglycan/xylan/chitin deacetylase (PgdA/CDA1 family)
MRVLKKFLIWLSSLIIIRSNKDEFIYLTFDDGPHPENTAKLLAILDRHEVKATFFMVGKEIDLYPQIAKQVYSKGHTLGYHSYDHSHAKDSSYKQVLHDLSHAKVLEDKYGLSFNRLYRPPFGALTLATFLAILVKGWKIVLWSKDSMDSYTDIENVCENLSIDNIKGGDIILLHDDYADTSSTIGLVLTHYKTSQIKCHCL